MARTPVIGGQTGRARLAESAAQQARLHRAVDDDAGAVRLAPGNQIGGRAALDRGKRRLQAVHMPQRLRVLQLGQVMVRQPHRADLALALERQQRFPVAVQRCAVARRPVHLIEVDPLHAQTAQRILDLAPDACRRAGAPWRGLRLRVGPGQAALGEHVGALGRRHLRQRAAHDLFGMAQAVDRRGIDPVDAPVHRQADRADGIGIVLRPPTHRPAIAAHGPGAQPDARDRHAGASQGTGRKGCACAHA